MAGKKSKAETADTGGRISPDNQASSRNNISGKFVGVTSGGPLPPRSNSANAHPTKVWAESQPVASGIVVEMVDPLIAHTAELIRAYLSLGKKRPAGSVNGRDFFGVSIGERAKVMFSNGELVLVEILGGSWKGRTGWAPLESVRVPPTEADSAADQIDGLTLFARRQIYADSHASGSAATVEAEARYPFDRMPTETEAVREYLSGRNAAYEQARDRGRREVERRYGIDGPQLDRIEEEGDRERWPLWDGLADDRGPIPSFGPAGTDETGRLVMGQEEREARRDASVRALSAIGQITDESDADEVWEQASAKFEGVR